MAVGIAVFAIQNSSASLLTLKFLIWKFETSLIYALLGSAGVGILMILFYGSQSHSISIRSRESKKKIENLEKMLYGPSPSLEKGEPSKEL
jgi:uncharacterized integral membrane protein